MSALAELERLEALLERLVPLSDMQRGELIEAADWNQVVEALVEVGRAALGSRQLTNVAPHEHSDQVALDWLDANVRQLLTGGGLKDPAIDARFSKLERSLARINAQLDSTLNDLGEARNRIDEVSTRDLVRENTITRLNRKVLGAGDDRADIADMRSTLKTLQTDITRAVDVGARLERNGNPIDVGALVTRVEEVERLRERLTQPSGELLDALAFERRILELESSLVTEADLTEAIKGVRDTPGSGLNLEGILSDVRNLSREVADARVAGVESDLRSRIDARLGDLAPLVQESVARSTENLREQILDASMANLEARLASGEEGLRKDLTTFLAAAFDNQSAGVEERFAGLERKVAESVMGGVDARLAEALGSINAELGAIRNEQKHFDARIDANTASIADVRTEVGVVQQEGARERSQLRAELLKRIEGVEGSFDPRIVTALDEARLALRTDIEASVSAAKRDLEGQIGITAREAAITEVQILSTNIRTDVSSMIRQEIDSNLAEVRKEISAEVEAINGRVASMVASEVKRSTANIGALVEAEFEALTPQINRMIDTRVGNRTVDSPILTPVDRTINIPGPLR